jgi:hypothetical protein
MLGLLFYIVVCSVVAIILSMIWVATRPIKSRDEVKSWKVMLFMAIFCYASPYLYVEVMTNMQGPKMLHAMKEAYNRTDVDGPIIYYKVLWYTPDHAKALVVGEERENWGGTDHPMVSVELSRKGDSWVADSYKLVSSGRLNKDEFVFPAYW